MKDELTDALGAGGGVISRRTHPELGRVIDWQLRTGRLRRVLPGVYADATAEGPVIDLLAAGLWRPGAVLTGAAAAKLTFWPELPLHRIDLADSTGRAAVRGRWRVERRRVPSELVRRHGPLLLTDPCLTALDLCASMHGDGIDAALRSRTASLAGMWEAIALSPGRRGNGQRRELLLDSRSEPWSAAERLLHRLLRGARIGGWAANVEIRVKGRRYFLDVAFARLKLVIEVDGRLAHGADAFEADRWRQNDLVLDGWTVLRITWAMLVDEPDEVLRMITDALKICTSSA